MGKKEVVIIEKIKEVYKRLISEYLFGQFYPDGEMMERIKIDLEKRLGSYIISVKCDEENNPPKIGYSGCIVAKIKWKEYPKAKEYTYTNLIFGNPWDVSTIKDEDLR